MFEDADHAAALFNLERAGHIYSRISNPTVAVLEERLAALENGVGAVCAASGMAALHLAIATLLGAGDHIVASASLYGGTINLLAHTLPRFGITTTFVKPRDLDGFRAAIRPRDPPRHRRDHRQSRPRSPRHTQLSSIAHDAGIPLLIDNTFASPYLCQPIELGADIVMHSRPNGSAAMASPSAASLVDGGRFDWEASGKFPTLTEPYAGYHGLVFTEQFGPTAFIMRARVEGLRDFGACLSPTNAFHLLQGVETLPLRMARHVENTGAVLGFSARTRPSTWVLHPTLPWHPDHELANNCCRAAPARSSASASRAGDPRERNSSKRCKLASHLANVGDAKTLVIHPASTTHQQMDAAQLAAAGIGEDMVRLSVGIENARDIIADLAQALRASQKV